MKPRVLVIAGTRPEAIKLAPLLLQLREDPDLDPRLVVTGQHDEILHDVFEAFGLEPELDLKLLRPGQSLEALVSRMLARLEPLLRRLAPRLLLVQGDTASAFAAALAAFYARVDIAHLEAGLRTRDPSNPFPEEINRRLVGVVTDLHLAPTPWAKLNLLVEGIPDEKIVVTGNTVVDALARFLDSPPLTDPNLRRVMSGAEGRRLVLVTSHRRENWGTPQASLARAVGRAALAFPDTNFAVALHPNPAVRSTISPPLIALPNVDLVEPLGYAEMIQALARSWIVVTDSGGIQEEACALGVPALILRETTERPEALAVGVARLIGTEENRVHEEIVRFLSDPQVRQSAAQASTVFGDGKASQRAHSALRRYLGLPATTIPEFTPPAFPNQALPNLPLESLAHGIPTGASIAGGRDRVAGAEVAGGGQNGQAGHRHGTERNRTEMTFLEEESTRSSNLKCP